jgi:hypothetical protein
MRFALLGADARTLPLVAASIAAGHELSWQGDVTLASPDGSPRLLATDDAESWEDLLVAETADFVIIGRGAGSEELRTRQVQELARLGRPMLVSFPLFASVLAYFEVDMSRAEGSALLVHYNPLCEAPQLGSLQQRFGGDHSRYGRLEQIVAARSLRQRSRERVVEQFAIDVDLLSRVAGKLNRIGAHASAGSGETVDYSALSVQLLGTAQLPVRWNVEPPGDAEGLALHLIGERGRETLWFDAEGAIDETPLLPARRAVDRFVAALAAERPGESTWPQALRAMELADSIEISLRRGRMIDIHDQQLTEQLAFKGTMSALGCGLLLLIVPGLLILGWIAGVVGIPLAEYWPHILLAILALFLGLQLLPKLLAKPPVDREP